MADMLQDNMEMEEDTQKDKYLTFLLSKESYGIEIKYVNEIIGLQEITAIPDLPDYIRGIINLRGEIVPVMDVRLRFHREPREYDDRTSIIVIDVENSPLGLIVDSVSEVISILEEDVVEPPRLNQAKGNRYIKNIGKVDDEVKLIIDSKKLLTEDELEELMEAF